VLEWGKELDADSAERAAADDMREAAASDVRLPSRQLFHRAAMLVVSKNSSVGPDGLVGGHDALFARRVSRLLCRRRRCIAGAGSPPCARDHKGQPLCIRPCMQCVTVDNFTA